HKLMAEVALQRLRQKASVEPIGFELLPEKFTMRQLQKVYEAIWDIKLDKRNFINKMSSFKFLKKLNQKEKKSSKRGAFYYKFDPTAYEKTRRRNFMLKY